MPINSEFQKQFGLKNKQQSSEDRIPSEYWLNVGYLAEWTDPETGEKEPMFISLPLGIPLDSMKTLPANAKNTKYREMQAAQNHLYEKIMEKAVTLEPGEDTIISCGSLSIQIRRRNSDAATPADTSANSLISQLAF